MIDSQDKTPAEKDGKYEFKLYYSEREVTCRVEKEQDKLHVAIDNNMDAELQINEDGTITQIEGAPLPASSIEFIKKQVLGNAI
jgi:ankyrin repeat protein